MLSTFNLGPHMSTVRIGSNSEYVTITFPPAYSVYRCAYADVEISVNCFHGLICPFVSADDIVLFTKQLRTLYETLEGEAIIMPLDRQFTLRILWGSGGRMHLAGVDWSRPVYESRLTFELELDQSCLPEPPHILETLCGLENKIEN